LRWNGWHKGDERLLEKKHLSLPTSQLMAVRMTDMRLPVILVLGLIGIGLFDPRIVSSGNLRNIGVQTSYLAVFAMAQTIVLLTRGFDLSLGLTVSFVSVGSALAINTGAGPFIGALAGLGIGVIIGLVNGFFIAVIGVNALVTTLGMANILLALASTISGGFPVQLHDARLSTLSTGAVASIPIPIIVTAFVFFALLALLKLSVFGRSLYVIGANPRAAYAAGIRTTRILMINYMVCSLLAAVGALMLSARTGSGEPNLGSSLTLESIAAAVVGGVRLNGGEGGVAAALVGALFVTILSNVMNLSQIDGYLQQVFLGLIILVSLVLGRERGGRWNIIFPRGFRTFFSAS
jgi:ribose transport system permease protein